MSSGGISVGVTVVVLTFNSGATIADVVNSCASFSARTVVIDSGSQDDTVAIAERLGCEVAFHPFENYSAQRNWAQRFARLQPEDWVLHVDSDEIVSTELASSIVAALDERPIGVDGFLVQRLTYFLGRPIRYGNINPSWHLRLYRAGNGACEERLYDQHFVVNGATKRLKGLLLDKPAATLEQWTHAHNRWSSAEAREISQSVCGGASEGALPATLRGDIRMKKRWLKNNIWYRMPLLARPALFFGYSYIIRLGFLDGKAGLIYNVLQAFWFRFLVDAKIYEARLNGGVRIEK